LVDEAMTFDDSESHEIDVRVPMRAENVRVGQTLGPLFYIVDAAQIAKFRTALDDANALFDPAGASSAALAPPTMRLQDYALLLASHFKGGRGGVHAKHRFEFIEPMRTGQAIRVEGRITSAERRRGKFYFTLDFEQSDAESGRTLCRQAITSVLLDDRGEMT
jgi:acyl dehydratase